MTSEMSRLSAELLPMANVLRALSTVHDTLPPTDRSQVASAKEAVLSEAVNAMLAFAGGALRGEHLADDLVYIAFHRGNAVLCGGRAPLLVHLDTIGLGGWNVLVGQWIDSARTGDIGSFMADAAGKDGFNVMVFRERWVGAG